MISVIMIISGVTHHTHLGEEFLDRRGELLGDLFLSCFLSLGEARIICEEEEEEEEEDDEEEEEDRPDPSSDVATFPSPLRSAPGDPTLRSRSRAEPAWPRAGDERLECAGEEGRDRARGT